LQRRSRPEQSDQRQPNQAANISHRPRASPDSTSLASRIEFPTMTGVEMVSLGEEARESPKGLWLTNARAVRIGRLSRKALRIFASDDFCDGARGISLALFGVTRGPYEGRTPRLRESRLTRSAPKSPLFIATLFLGARFLR
jgi:hypothetical protein